METYCEVMAIELGALFAFLALGVWLFAIFDVITSPVDGIRIMQKPIWVIVVLLGFVMGAVVWFALGRPRSAGDGTSGGFGALSGPKRARPIAPDDDVEFLRGLRKRPDENGPPASA